ncbi:phosphoribosyl-AMP cyclohydrolase [Gordonia pseudamarae]|jgi:phosphoribosyl-AMP cyclohydrolase|uniref:Phosphoribosyl-AMP cyclohydrolase n=1 Tax=Gordonia pseudamarae TaxID=2831662 RepID=A0ABX6IJU7_9ACTN|nr:MULTISPECIES: phosphoribosyl-AMP cyclohydrolase [Gordonia]MBD0022976.1 phosphoribosyl-AMP cyclohydrolase [Gordonia sp. (in: high G+C Gram-positive bacteria)]QHN26746.1 phosphoribosyl-AMP cyclohydrolase [Gordonia pseudamarae]QHN35639.1 phosphoribosyl-AMP cyclohydrolase [Gordonia pseudamarae]
MALDPELSTRLTRNDDGLFAAIAQERGTGVVLMMAWMDDTALERTLDTRRATYWSRSRQQYWVKGETSGHFQTVHDVRVDCDGDTLLLIVDQDGAACHTGSHSCFDTSSLLPGVTAPQPTFTPESAGADPCP